MSQQPSRAQQLMGDITPKLAELTDNVLFGDVYERPGLSQRDRSLITVSALLSLNRKDQLKSHMGRALDNGVTQDELAELITQLAFYAGWPCGIDAATTLRTVINERKEREAKS
jgi:4-carboxymuconolactone decarboxylase